MSNGKIIPGQEYDKSLNLVKEFTQQMLDIPSFVAVEGSNAIDGVPNDAGSVQTKDYDLTQIQAQLDAFYRVFVGNGSVDLPRVLLAIFAVWESSSQAGSYSESGTGFSAGGSVALSLTAQGRAQGSASVLPELVPRWYPLWTNDLPVVDFFFFMPDNATRAEIIAKACTVASLFFGTATTVLDWPFWQPVEINLSIAGQKISISAEAVSRCSVSISGADVSETTSSGSGTSQDVGHSIRPVNIPLCLNPGIAIQGPTMSQTVTTTASAVVTAGTNFPGESASSSITGTANGLVSPASIEPTVQPGYPATGIYGKIDASQFDYGYSAYRVRTLDFSIFPHVPQITPVDFADNVGSEYGNPGGAGLAFALVFNNNTVAVGIWFFITNETQPDLTAYGVPNYLRITLTGSENAAQLATAVQTACAASLSSNATATIVNGGSASSAVQFVDTRNGPENLSPYNDTQAVISLVQLGT